MELCYEDNKGHRLTLYSKIKKLRMFKHCPFCKGRKKFELLPLIKIKNKK